MQTPRFLIIRSADYLQIRCAEDNERCTLEFKEYDPSIALVEVTCPQCGGLGPIKFDGFTISRDWQESLIAMGETKSLVKH